MGSMKATFDVESEVAFRFALLTFVVIVVIIGLMTNRNLMKEVNK